MLLVRLLAVVMVAAGLALSACGGDYADDTTIQARCNDHGGVSRIDDGYYVICRDGHLTTNRK